MLKRKCMMMMSGRGNGYDRGCKREGVLVKESGHDDKQRVEPSVTTTENLMEKLHERKRWLR